LAGRSSLSFRLLIAAIQPDNKGRHGDHGDYGGDHESEGFHQMRLRPGSSGRVGTPFQFHQPW
jgi:hypothetical protein